MAHRGCGWIAASVVLLLVSVDARAQEVKTETCVQLKETKISGKICRGLIANACDHEVELTIQYDLALRRLIIHPVTAEGPASSYVDGGRASETHKGTLDPGESKWFEHVAEGKGIEIARCKMGFSYTHE